MLTVVIRLKKRQARQTPPLSLFVSLRLNSNCDYKHEIFFKGFQQGNSMDWYGFIIEAKLLKRMKDKRTVLRKRPK